ncbi:hypothetical protein K502DRAFT_362847 [Neoconidiobolus thromboides FSU 785]|nr:hypothetical protein K502DRAFT_362847 [Neoconidiobolus thromboides FSU 785]
MSTSERSKISDLNEVISLQKEEISNLKLQLEKVIQSKSLHKDILVDMERNQSEINKSLQDQLEKALKLKADLEDEFGLDDSLEESKTSDPEKLSKDLIKAKAMLKKLKFELEMEKGQSNILRHDNMLLKKMTVELHASAEQEEEFISNRLLKKISGLKKEKGDLLQLVEQEEEYLTNSLQKRIIQLQKEKVDLENALEQEQEFVVNKLQKQLDSFRLQYPSHTPSPTLAPSHREQLTNSPPLLPTTMISSSPPTSGGWRPSHSPSASDYGGASPGVVEMLKAEVTSLRLKLSEMEREVISAYNQTKRYKNELNDLRKTNNLPVVEDSIGSTEYVVRSRRSISNASSNAPLPSSSPSDSRRHSARSLSMSGDFVLNPKEAADGLPVNPSS